MSGARLGAARKPHEDNIPTSDTGLRFRDRRVHRGLSTSLCWLNKSVRQRATRKQVPTSSGLGLLQLGAVGGKLTNALLQVAEHVVGLRFDCLGKGSVHTLGQFVRYSFVLLVLSFGSDALRQGTTSGTARGSECGNSYSTAAAGGLALRSGLPGHRQRAQVDKDAPPEAACGEQASGTHCRVG